MMTGGVASSIQLKVLDFGTLMRPIWAPQIILLFPVIYFKTPLEDRELELPCALSHSAS